MTFTNRDKESRGNLTALHRRVEEDGIFAEKVGSAVKKERGINCQQGGGRNRGGRGDWIKMVGLLSK